jgi:hypothetical protein
LDTTSKYNVNSREFIPHATLGMKTLSDEQIQNMFHELTELNLNKQNTKTIGYYAREVPPSWLWTWINIEKTNELKELQKLVLWVSKKYDSKERSPETYAIDDFYEKNEILFFTEDEYLKRDGLHITLWKQDIQNEYKKTDMPVETEFSKLVVGKIWNYWSVREILFEIPLN